jgi:hypothetical protein
MPEFPDRTSQLLRGIDKTMCGVEIGPFYNPLAPKKEGWNTVVVDFTDKAGLLSVAENHTEPVIREMSTRIEDVDIVWAGEPLHELCLPRNPGGYDYLITSHVLEHIPDIIRFFQSAAELLKPSGICSIAMPDLRYTFDFFKAPSTTANALAAYRERRKIHSPETMFEAWGYNAALNGVGCWTHSQKGEIGLISTLAHVKSGYDFYLRDVAAGTQKYVDAHCWYFTPSGFELMILELNLLGYCKFVVSDIGENEGSEFIAQLSRGSYEISDDEIREMRLNLLKRAALEHASRVSYFAEQLSASAR